MIAENTTLSALGLPTPSFLPKLSLPISPLQTPTASNYAHHRKGLEERTLH